MHTEPTSLSHYYRMQGAVQLSHKRSARLLQRTVGTLVVTSGSIVACDPATGGAPFTEQVSAGQYPVVLTVLTEEDDARVAYARLDFRNEAPTNWKLATWPEVKRGWFNRGQPTGYGVDSAMGCFMDGQAEQILRRYEGHKRPAFVSGALTLDETLGETCAWGSAVLDASSGLNMIVFSAGLGDGYYSSYLGYSAAGEVVTLVTDFKVLHGED